MAALLAQQPMTRPFTQSSGNSPGPVDMNALESFPASELAALRNLEDGAMVVMYAGPGELIIVRPNGKYWELEAISTTEEAGENTLQSFPSVSIFQVIKRGRHVGFKSLAADGRTLQAVAAEESVPLRVNNYNFGPWESWEVSGTGFANKKWPNRMLGLEVREIQAVTHEDLRKVERASLRLSKDLQRQLRTLELKHQETKRHLQEHSRHRKRMTAQHQRELEDSRGRLEEALRAKQRLEVDAVQIGARLKQKDLQLQQVTLQRDTAESTLADRESNQRAHERELEILKEKHKNDIDGIVRHHRNEIESLKREREHEVGRSAQHANGEVTMLQQRLQQAEQDKERELRHCANELNHTIQQKQQEIFALRDENRKLTSALHQIREQLTNGFYAVNSSEVAPSRAGTERSLDLQSASFQRFSPAGSRASTGRRPEDTGDGSQFQYERMGLHHEGTITPRRGSLPIPPTSPYGGRFSPGMSPEPFGLRASADLRPPRRGDSRLSDNTGLGRTSDDASGLYARPGSRSRRLTEAYNPRHAIQLDSVEDNMSKACSEYQDDDDSERGDDVLRSKQPNVEVNAHGNAMPRQTDEEMEVAQEPQQERDARSERTEEVVVAVENTTVAEQADGLSSSDDSEIVQESWMRQVTAPVCPPLTSESESESDKDSKQLEE